MAPSALTPTQRHGGGLALALTLAALPAPAPAAPAKRPAPAAPGATYTLEARTVTGLGAGGMGSAEMMRMVMGGGASSTTSSRSLELRLQGSRVPAEAPKAEHRIPAGLALGTALPLLSSGPSRGTEAPEPLERPKGRLLIFRGCGETAGSGQPEVLDLAKLVPDAQQLAALQGAMGKQGGRGVAREPAAAAITGTWPNGDSQGALAATASLVGDHSVVSNYAPELRFRVEASHDFLAPLQLSASPAGAAWRLSWQPVATVLGYQAMATSAGKGPDELVIWTSSSSGWAGSAIPANLDRRSAAQLIAQKVLLPPEATSCSISAQASAAMAMPVLQVTAYGDPLTVTGPAGATPWRVSLRRESTASRLLMAGMPGADDAAGGEAEPTQPRGFKLFPGLF
ncbi:hypothetical protein [Vulcanococcus limneticus]|uniref:hypothetical protein n=1 Tax=Vulcanococcus limneticus TaxID=2170428 RepID=UPI00398C05A7